jgi:hypothetical protein
MVNPMDEHRYIFGTPERELTKTKEVKMRIPIAHLIRLHGLKLLSGQNISETVTKALEMYFDKVDREKGGAGATAVAEGELAGLAE